MEACTSAAELLQSVQEKDCNSGQQKTQYPSLWWTKFKSNKIWKEIAANIFVLKIIFNEKRINFSKAYFVLILYPYTDNTS